jgi:hypothetical protein
MLNTPEKAATKMRQLGLPPIFEQIWTSQGHRRFCRQWDRPARFFDAWQDSVQRCPRIRMCVPLLESNRERVVAFDVKQNEFIEYYYGDADCRPIGKSYQQFLSSLFVELGYAGLVDLVEEVAAEFDYNYLDSFLKFMETDDDSTADDARRAFVGSIPT